MQPDTKEENMFFPDGNTLILNEQEQKECEGFLTASECLESLKSMAVSYTHLTLPTIYSV